MDSAKTDQQKRAGQVPEVPNEITESLESWEHRDKRHLLLYYFAGPIGIAASAVSAAGATVGLSDKWKAIFAVVSTACFGILGFVHPYNNHLKFSRAVHLVKEAVLRFKYANEPVDSVIDAFQKAQTLISETEAGTAGKAEGFKEKNLTTSQSR